MRRGRRVAAMLSVAAIGAAACGGEAPESVASSSTVVRVADDTSVAATTTTTTTVAGGGASTLAGRRAASFVGSWEVRLGERVDTLRITEHDGEVWIVAVFREHVWVGRSDEPASSWHRIDQPPFRSVDMVSTDDGLVVVVGFDAEPASVWIRRHARTWERHVLDVGFLPSGLTVIDGRLWLSGSQDVAPDPGITDMQPGLLVSDDGIAWTDVGPKFDVGLDEDGLRNRAFRSLVESDGQLLAVLTARLDRGGPATFVASVDGGVTWTAPELDGPVPSSIRQSRGTVYGFDALSESDDRPVPVVRLDPVAGWIPIDVAVDLRPEPLTAGVSSGDGALVAAYTMWDDRDRTSCWYPIGQTECGESSMWFATGFETGSPTRIEIADPDRSYPPLVVLSTTTGRIVTARAGSDRLVVEEHDAALVEPAPPVLHWGGSIDVGETYRYSINTHCGIGHLGRLHDSDWYLVGEPSGELPSESEELERVWVDLTVVAPDEIVIDADGLLIATYEPGADLQAECE